MYSTNQQDLIMLILYAVKVTAFVYMPTTNDMLCSSNNSYCNHVTIMHSAVYATAVYIEVSSIESNVTHNVKLLLLLLLLLLLFKK